MSTGGNDRAELMVSVNLCVIMVCDLVTHLRDLLVVVVALACPGGQAAEGAWPGLDHRAGWVGHAGAIPRWRNISRAAAWPRKTTAQLIPVTAHTPAGPKNAPVAAAVASPTHRP
jgi:hypothetical protein